MKKWVVFVSLALAVASCSTDVNIYDEYKDIPVVYGLIDAYADTNYIKITKAYAGTNDNPIDANEAALIYDSSNYAEKLDVYFEELKSTNGMVYQPTGRRFWLDTLTIHDKEPGQFYSPDQLLYFTDQPFKTNTGNEKYHYKLYIVKPEGDTATAETGIVSGDIGVGQTTIGFQSEPSSEQYPMLFSSTEEGVLYELGMQFHYWEGHPGEPLRHKEVSWSFGTRPLSSYEKVPGTENFYRVYYPVNALFNYLEQAIGNDTVWDVNHPNVVRYVDDIVVFIAAAGEDFYNYYLYMQSMQNGLSLTTEYTNVYGGYGLLSSRIYVERACRLSSRAIYDLFRKPWGFQEQ